MVKIRLTMKALPAALRRFLPCEGLFLGLNQHLLQRLKRG